MTAQLKPWSWRRVRNPHPAKWPGAWIEWQAAAGNEGTAALTHLASYVGEERALNVARMLAAGRRAGRLLC